MDDDGSDGEPPHERRWEDQKLIPGLVKNVSWWWDHATILRRTSFLVGMIVALGTCGFQVGVGTEYVRGQWEGIPSRVAGLEQYRDTATAPAIEDLSELESRVDSIASGQEDIRGTLEEFGEGQEELYDIAEWNNCLLRVQAEQEDVSNCGPGGSP